MANLWTFNTVGDETMGLLTHDIRRPVLPEVARSTVEVAGMPGSYVMQTNPKDRRIEIEVGFTDATLADLTATAHALAAWLYSTSPLELTFADEPDYVYYAQLDGSTDLDAILRYRRGTITFVCSNPYANALTADETTITSGTTGASATVTNAGGIETYPTLSLTMAASGTTFLDARCGEGFLRMGFANELGADTPADPMRLDFHEDFSGTGGPPAGWSAGSGICEGGTDTGGTMVRTDTGAIELDTVPEGSGFLGASIYRDLSTPATDFRIDMLVYWTNSAIAQMGRIQVYALDSIGGVIGKAGIQDSWGAAKQTAFHATAGPIGGTYKSLFNNTPADPTAWNTLDYGMLRFSRVTKGSGTLWTSEIYKLDANGRPTWRLSRTLPDPNGAYGTDDLHSVAIHIAEAGASAVSKMWVSEVWAYEVTASSGMTQSTNIAQEGDVITIDMYQGGVFLNGGSESRVPDPANPSQFLPMSALVHLNSTYWPLAVGSNPVEITADCAVTGTVTHTERWL